MLSRNKYPSNNLRSFQYLAIKESYVKTETNESRTMNGTDGVEYSRPGSNMFFFCFASIDTPMPNIVLLKNDASSIHQPPILLFIYSINIFY